MPVTRPSAIPFWAVTGTRLNPGTPATNVGWQPDEVPPCEWMNYLQGLCGDWIAWLDQEQQMNASQLEFDATIGTNGTYPDINSLMTAMAGGFVANKVLVTTLQTLATSQIIPNTIADLEFVFKPNAFYSKGLGVTPGLICHGQRITFRGGRWMNFNNAGDKAIQLAADSKNCRIADINFFNCDTAVDDLGQNNVIEGIIEEV